LGQKYVKYAGRNLRESRKEKAAYVAEAFPEYKKRALVCPQIGQKGCLFLFSNLEANSGFLGFLVFLESSLFSNLHEDSKRLNQQKLSKRSSPR
jgi:hypothetical protein